MKTILAGALLAFCTLQALGQGGFDPRYKPVGSGSWVQDKDFYLFTLMEQPGARALLQRDTVLQRRLAAAQDLLSSVPASRAKSPQEFVKGFLWTPEDITAVGTALSAINGLGPMVREMRRSGYWIRDSALSDTGLLRDAWEAAARAENRLIDHYTTNKGFRYAGVDSATFAPSSPIAKEMLGETLMMLYRHRDSMTLFYQPALELALDILFINNRDEPGRFEPLDSTNADAYKQARSMAWSHYPYTAILLPGEGPENDWSMSPVGKYRCQLGAEQYRLKQAPFIIVSGGFVHPFQTPYCEAAEMKAYLVNALGIPASAVILEPQARHTTTNIRNANRIMLRHGFPETGRVLCVSTAGQIGYIMAPFFAGRCRLEMGYVPFSGLRQVDPFSVSYLMDPASLEMDATDPLDP